MTLLKKKRLRNSAVMMMSIAALSLVGGNLLFAISDTSISEPKVLNETWHFTGSTRQEAINPDFYEQGSSPECDAGAETICEITAPIDPSSSPSNPKPHMEALVNGSQTVEEQILEALDDGINDTVLSLRSL